MLAIILTTAALGPKTQAVLDKINDIRGWVVGLMIALSVIFIVYAAYLYLMAGTEPDNINKAKQIIIYVVLALAIALLSSLIVNVVGKLIGG